jgi:hypothetical protein
LKDKQFPDHVPLVCLIGAAMDSPLLEQKLKCYLRRMTHLDSSDIAFSKNVHIVDPKYCVDHLLAYIAPFLESLEVILMFECISNFCMAVFGVEHATHCKNNST